jgi:hypothetical protein
MEESIENVNIVPIASCSCATYHAPLLTPEMHSAFGYGNVCISIHWWAAFAIGSMLMTNMAANIIAIQYRPLFYITLEFSQESVKKV